MKPSPSSVTAIFTRERIVFDSAPRTIIGEAATPTGNVTIKGQAFDGELIPGVEYIFFGKTVVHPKYGTQFAFNGFRMNAPVSRDCVVAYLSACCRGIGPKLAGKIFDHCGDTTIDQLVSSPEKVAEAVSGLSTETAIKAAERLREHGRESSTRAELTELLARRGFRRTLIDQIIETFGERAPNLIRENPFILLGFSGAGFVRVDKLFIDLGGRHDDITRQMYCGLQSIQKNSRGSTWVPEFAWHAGINQQISGADVDSHRALGIAIEKGKVELNQQGFLSLAFMAEQERVSAECVSMLAASTDHQWPDVSTLNLYDSQKREAAKATRSRVGVLCGSPGTGKTHTTAEIIKAVAAVHGTTKVAVAAPTGKAAVRISQAMSDAGLDSITAKTVHSLLGVIVGDEWAFEYGHGNHLPHKFIFIDESSMLDTWMFSMLISAVGPQSHILFIGDPNQLPPVGHGSPLLDIIAAGVPCGKLTEIHRNSGAIVKACASIRDKRTFNAVSKMDVANGENLIHIEAQGDATQLEVIRRFYSSLSNPQFLNRLDLEVVDPVWDVQVIVPVNKKSLVSREQLNKTLQGILNPNSTELEEREVFAVGDKVVCLKNGDAKCITFESPDLLDEKGCCRVANGEIGHVIDISQGKLIIRLSSPARTVAVPFSVRTEDNEEMEAGSESDEDSKPSTGCNWDLAYAISCHKSQGDQYKIVLVIVDGSNGAKNVQNVQWIYTAISRAKQACVVIGDGEDIKQMCRRNGLSRKTFLKEEIESRIGERLSEGKILDLMELLA